MKEEKKMIDDEYREDPLQDDDHIYHIKEAVSKLNTIQRQIFLTYTELGTYTETARHYKVSVPTMRKYIQEIREKIFNNL